MNFFPLITRLLDFLKESRDFKEKIHYIKVFFKNFLKEIPIINIFIEIKKKKLNRILDHPIYFEKFLKKIMNKSSKEPFRIKQLFNSNKLFAFCINERRKEITNLINLKFPNFQNELLKKANKITINKFRVFEKEKQFSNKISWLYSFFDDIDWPNYHSTRMSIKHPRKTIDIKYNWEFNRHSFLPTLALAYYFTNDEKYVKKLLFLLFNWIERNAPRFNTNWMNPLEVSIRLINWSISLLLVKESQQINGDAFYRIFKSLLMHAYFIKTNSSKYDYNHTIGEFFGLFLFAFIFKDIKTINKWYKKSLKVLENQISRQTLDDGVNIERAINYHRFALEFFTLFLLITPKKLDYKKKLLINEMFSFLAYIVKPNNNIPLIGDFDDSFVIPSCFFNNIENYHYFIELISIGAILFNRSDLKYISKGISPALILLLGENGLSKFEQLKEEKPNEKYYFFKIGGYFIARDNYEDDSNYLLFDMANFGPRNASHAHFDISNVIYSYKGKPIFIDTGTFRYNDTLSWRKTFKRAEAHNILTINDFLNVNLIDYNIWAKKPNLEMKVKESNDRYILEVHHDSFKYFDISRQINFSKELHHLHIKDSIFYKKKKDQKTTINLYFHFPKDTNLLTKNNNVIINDLLKMTILNNFNQPIKIVKEEHYYSPSYGLKYLIPVINIELNVIFEKSNFLELITEIRPLY